MNKIFLHRLLIILLIPFTLACSNSPDPINYGEDNCDYCRMSIVDKQHAAQLVTDKGKNYKYDAIECMINDLKKWDKPPVEIYLVADYANPGVLTDARPASYLISKNIPSPMGEFLSAFADESKRNATFESSGGEKYNWNQLISHFDEK